MDDATTHNKHEESLEAETGGPLPERAATPTPSHLGSEVPSGTDAVSDGAGGTVARPAFHGRPEPQVRGTAAPRVVATAEARRLLRVACEEAVQAKAPALGSEHLVVAVLLCGGNTAEALTDAGVTLERARTYASDLASGPARRSRSDSSRTGLRGVVSDAAAMVAARDERRIDANTLLLAALSDPDEGAARVLAALAVDLVSVQRRLCGDAAAARRPHPRSGLDAA